MRDCAIPSKNFEGTHLNFDEDGHFNISVRNDTTGFFAVMHWKQWCYLVSIGRGDMSEEDRMLKEFGVAFEKR